MGSCAEACEQPCINRYFAYTAVFLRVSSLLIFHLHARDEGNGQADGGVGQGGDHVPGVNQFYPDGFLPLGEHQCRMVAGVEL